MESPCRTGFAIAGSWASAGPASASSCARLRIGRPTEAELRASKVTMGVDLAISTKDGADYTAAVVVARHPDGRIWVLDAARTRATFQDVLRFVQAMAAKHQPSTILVEQVQFQAVSQVG